MMFSQLWVALPRRRTSSQTRTPEIIAVEAEADGEEDAEDPADRRIDLSRTIKAERRTSKQDSRQRVHRPKP
jgi:hypothetical protein